MESKTAQGLNLLSIDAGYSGLQALYIIQEIFSRLAFDLNLTEELRPCYYFDIIIGTGLGVLSAILLGRLGMTPSQAIDAYEQLESALFVNVADNEEEREKNGKDIEEAFRILLADAKFEADISMLDSQSAKTVVCTLNASNISVLYPIRSYNIRGAPSPPCTVLQAACAGIASPHKFLPVSIGKGHRKVSLIDATVGYANPTMELLHEAERVFGSDRGVASIVSIGAGKGAIQTIAESVQTLKLNDLLNGVIVNCERIHQELHSRLRESGIYFRFNVDDNKPPEPSTLYASTSTYLQDKVVSDAIDKAIEAIKSRTPGAALQDINSVTPIEITLKPRPAPVAHFIGREEILRPIVQKHMSHSSGQTTTAITVLWGLGGSGKTQIALKFALQFEKNFPDAVLYLLSASSEATLQTDLELISQSRGSAFRSSSYKDTLVWLAKSSKPWLMIMDNADEPSLPLSQYIPNSGLGHVIITTRNAMLQTLSYDSSHEVKGLSESEATTLLLNMSRHQHTASNQLLAETIAKELGYLPLALAHAGAYILIHNCLPDYLQMYRQSSANLLRDTPHLSHGYPHSVAGTIQMSLDRLSDRSKNLLRVFSQLDSRSISYNILEKSANRSFRHVAYGASQSISSQSEQYASSLESIFCPSGKWIMAEFEESIGECLKYSLLRVTPQNGSRFYSIHTLVQAYLRSGVEIIQGHHPRQLAARLLASAMTIENRYDHTVFNQSLLPHIKLVELEDITEAGDYYGFGSILQEMGDAKRAILHLERCVEIWKVSPGDDTTLNAMMELGSCYSRAGNEEKALELREETWKTCERLLGGEANLTAKAMLLLANSYSTTGREQAALGLREKVLEVRTILFGQEDRHTIMAMNDLANSYSRIGEDEKALHLREVVLEKRKKILGIDHHETVEALSNLDHSYSRMGNNKKALELREIVLDKRMKLLGEEHRDTVTAMGNLANSYSIMEKYKEALDLRILVLERRKELLGPWHRDTIDAVHNLAHSYSRSGEDKKALVLREEVLKKRRALLEPGHLDIVEAMKTLAHSYSRMGRKKEALSLREEVLNNYESNFGHDHPKTREARRSIEVTSSKMAHKRK